MARIQVLVRRSTLLLGVAFLFNAISARSALADNSYFAWVSAKPETILARSYRTQAEIDADIPTQEENRENPPIYDPVIDAAKWTIPSGSGGISIKDQVRPSFPMVSNGNLLFIWEARWDPDFPFNLNGMHTQKAFQMSRDSAGDQRRIEIRTRFSLASAPNVAEVDGRSYVWEPSEQPMSGQINEFTIEGATWTRFWALVDFEGRTFSFWVADEDSTPVQIYDDFQFDDMPGGLDNFWFEFNSSQSRDGGDPLDIWARNFVVLHNVDNVGEIISEGQPTVAVPRPPENLTIDGAD